MNVYSMLSVAFFVVSLGALIWLIVRAAREHVLWAVAVFLLSPISATVFAIAHWKSAKQPFLLYLASSVFGLALAFQAFLSLGGGDVIRTASQVQGEAVSEEQARAFMRANLDFIANSGVEPEDQAKLDTMRRFVDMSATDMSEREQRDMAREIIAHVDPASLDDEGRQQLELLRSEFGEPSAESGAAADDDRDASTGAEAEPTPTARRRAAPALTMRWEYVTVDPSEAAAYVGASVKMVGANGTERSGTLTSVVGQRLRVERRLSGGKMEYEFGAEEVRSFKVRKQVSASS